MIILLGAAIVMFSVLGGFVMAGGNIGNLIHISEWIIIGGAGLGSMIIMAPKKILMELFHMIIASFKGVPYGRADYDDLFRALYELFVLGRRNGMVALEEHVLAPQSSAIFQRYPGFLNNAKAMEFVCGGLKPIIDGRIKPDQLRHLLEVELDRLEEESHAPVGVLRSTSDAMPGFGIVAAVLGIVITMQAIAGPIETIGAKVAAALVGTFLGIFMAYGFLSPLATNLDFINQARLAYLRCISECVASFANGQAPLMAIEFGRRSLEADLCPTADELETMLKGVGGGGKK
jgi:chemotaxis protein MotA